MNAFIIFSMRHRSEVHRLYPNKDNRVASQILGDWWYRLNASEKAPYQELARELKAAHFQSFPNWKWSSKERRNSGNANGKKSCTILLHSDPKATTHTTGCETKSSNKSYSVKNIPSVESFSSSESTNEAMDSASLVVNVESNGASKSNLLVENNDEKNSLDKSLIKDKSFQSDNCLSLTSNQCIPNGIDLLLHAVEYLDKNNVADNELTHFTSVVDVDLDSDVIQSDVTIKNHTPYGKMIVENMVVMMRLRIAIIKLLKWKRLYYHRLLSVLLRQKLTIKNRQNSKTDAFEHSLVKSSSSVDLQSCNKLQLKNQQPNSILCNSTIDLSSAAPAIPQVSVYSDTLLYQVPENVLLYPLSINLKPMLPSSPIISGSFTVLELDCLTLPKFIQHSTDNANGSEIPNQSGTGNEKCSENEAVTNASKQQDCTVKRLISNATAQVNISYPQVVQIETEEKCAVPSAIDDQKKPLTSDNPEIQHVVPSKARPPPLKLESCLFDSENLNKNVGRFNRSAGKSTHRTPLSADAANRSCKRKFDENIENIFNRINFRRRFSYLPKFKPNSTEELVSPVCISQVLVASTESDLQPESTQYDSKLPTMITDTNQQLYTLTSPTSHLSDSENIQQSLSPRQLDSTVQCPQNEDNRFFGRNFPNITETKWVRSTNLRSQISSSSPVHLMKNHPIAPKSTRINAKSPLISQISKVNGTNSRSVLHTRRKLVLELFREYGLFPSIPVITRFQQCYAYYFPSRQALQLKIREVRRRIMQENTGSHEKSIGRLYNHLVDRKTIDDDDDDDHDDVEVEMANVEIPLGIKSKLSLPSTNINRCYNNHTGMMLPSVLITGTHSSLSNPLAV
ncbi:unnamed protein product [Heterobilharzia americana]|nr:unnamed protein product [Heterobilharzia americana]